MTKGKIIVIDWHVFTHTAIFAWRNNKGVPATFTGLNMILSCLRRIGVEPEDTIYLAVDFLTSWRKEYAEEYKANRKAMRESYEDIDWKKMYSDFDNLLNILDKATDWIVLKNEHLEADDFASYIVRHNQDREIILVTIDKDWQQMWHFNNVKIFSPKSKPKRYKIKPSKFNVYHLIASKVKKEESDNLISPILNEKDYDTRMMLINLLELPEFIDKQIKETFDNIKKEEEINSDLIPFTSLREKIEGIYNDKKDIVTYEWSENLEKKREKRRSKK